MTSGNPNPVSEGPCPAPGRVAIQMARRPRGGVAIGYSDVGNSKSGLGKAGPPTAAEPNHPAGPLNAGCSFFKRSCRAGGAPGRPSEADSLHVRPDRSKIPYRPKVFPGSIGPLESEPGVCLVVAVALVEISHFEAFVTNSQPHSATAVSFPPLYICALVFRPTVVGGHMRGKKKRNVESRPGYYGP